MRTACLALLLFLSGSVFLAAQTTAAHQTPPVEVKDSRLITMLTPRVAIHAPDEPALPDEATATPIQRAMHARSLIYDNMVAVSLEVVVNENGRVESAHATDGPERFRAQAEQIEMQRAFAPIQVDGHIVRARVHDYVSVLPPETWAAQHTPFPFHLAPSSTQFSLERTLCFGSCPAYSVTVAGDGTVTFTSGEPNTVAVPGTHTAHISPEAVQALADAFRSADFLSARDSYTCGWTDLPTQTLTMHWSGGEKKVVDYGGSLVGLPDAIGALETAVDQAAGTDRWVKGNADTLPALRAEHWNFGSASRDNLLLYDTALERHNTELTGLMLAARAPVWSDDDRVASPACAASGMGDLDTVKDMLVRQPKGQPLPTLLLAECLSRAARGGSLPVVELWLDRGARPIVVPKAEDSYEHDNKYYPPMLAAVASGKPDVVARLLRFHPDLSVAGNRGRSVVMELIGRGTTASVEDRVATLKLLVAAGADVNTPGNMVEGPLFSIALEPELIPVLVAGGAEVNAREGRGQTPLIRNAFSEPAVRALLAAGADPLLRDERGKTALDAAQSGGCNACVTLLEQAVADRGGRAVSSQAASGKTEPSSH